MKWLHSGIRRLRRLVTEIREGALCHDKQGSLNSFPEDVQIIFVQELALIAFLTKTAKPMFADKIVERMRDLVFIWTRRSQWTVALSKGFTEWTIGIEAKAILPSQKVREGKIERRLGCRTSRDIFASIQRLSCGCISRRSY